MPKTSTSWIIFDADSLKYEEISPPHTEDFGYITDNTCKKQEVVKMEADVPKHLSLRWENQQLDLFLDGLLKLFNKIMIHPICSLEFIIVASSFLPSLNSALQQQSGYKPSDLKECVQILHDLQSS